MAKKQKLNLEEVDLKVQHGKLHKEGKSAGHFEEVEDEKKPEITFAKEKEHSFEQSEKPLEQVREFDDFDKGEESEEVEHFEEVEDEKEPEITSEKKTGFDFEKLEESLEQVGEFDDFDKGEESEEVEYFEEVEDKKEPKKTFAEKRTISVQEKLVALREKMSSNPPKTIIGKKLAIARLNRLSNIVDRKILKNNIKALSKSREYKSYENYYSKQQELMGEISDLYLEKDNILRQIRRLEHWDPTNSKSIFAEQQKKVIKNMPRGYKPKVNDSVQHNNKILKQKEELMRQLRKIEKSIDENEKNLKVNDKTFEEQRINIKQEMKKELAVVRQNPFRKIKNFFNKKKEQFKSWREEKGAKAKEKLFDTIKHTEDISKREIFLKGNASDISLEQQSKYSEEIQEKLQKKATREEPQQETEKDRETE